MNDPYLTLEVSEDADDATIHQAYLQKVRAFPPERAPQRFQTIRSAYEAIQTEHKRWQYRLFALEPPPLSDLLGDTSPGQRGRPDMHTLLAALDWSLRQPVRENEDG